jgi:hypothetical protein
LAGVAPIEEDTNMTKSIIAALALTAGVAAFAGPSLAYDSAQAPVKKHHKPVRDVHPEPSRTAEIGTTQFRIPAHPIVRDCVHVFFPQCSRGYEGLNDGSFSRY